MSDSTSARVRVPCSTSNLGAGFDCIGIALDRYLDAEVTLGGDGVTIDGTGTLASLDGMPPEEQLLYRGFEKAALPRGRMPRGVTIAAHSEIPVARGLGSSAASLVAGAMLANAALGLGLTAADLVDIGVMVEGHPDNVAPIVHGGAVLAVKDRAGSYALSPLDVHESLGIALAIPDFETSTRMMRAALPDHVPHVDAVSAAGRAAALVRGLATGDGPLLARALDDVLHVPYRRTHVRGYDAVVSAAIAAGAFGATLSGSGSTLLALAPRDAAERGCHAMRDAWQAIGVAAEGRVATIAGAAHAR